MKKAFLVLIATACMMVTVALADPPREVWNKVYYGGTTNRPGGVAVDASGNVYVTGTSKHNYDWGYYTIKYDTDGNLQWDKFCDLNGDLGLENDVAVDALSNIYVVGTDIASHGTNFEYRTIKYDTNGNIQWNKVYNPGNNNLARGVAVDASNNVYLTGYSWDNYDCDYHTIKYDTDGIVQWERTYGWSSSTDEASGVAADASGNIYVTGTVSTFNGGYNYRTIKYDTDGNWQWGQLYNSGDEVERANDIAVDASGNIYVTGYSNSDYCTIKYDTDGNLQWDKFYDLGNDYPNSIAVDVSGNIYVTGETQYKTGPDANCDYCTIKYDTDGNLQWEKLYDSGDDDAAKGIVVDSLYNIYVTGRSNRCYRTIKYVQDGIPTVTEQPKADNLQLKVLRNITSNPVLQYTLPPSTNGNLVLYSSDGRIVEKLTLTEPESSVTFDCSLPSGVYFAKLTTESNSTIAKVVLVK